MAKQLDCTTSIESSQNNGVHGIHFGPHMSFSRLNYLASKQNHESINISAVDWTTWKSNPSNLQMPCENSSLNSISGSAMIVGLKMTHISLEHYTTGIFSNVSSSSYHILLFWHATISNRCASQTLRVIKSTARWTRAISGGIHKINFLQERRLCLSFVHPTKRTWKFFRAISKPGNCISW